ncbi:MAG TPA: hypothetical protein VJJ82_02730 [Candidatus Nanoarchaeia archaeon]|nr:hypothetical protein [Candidatus Nanoarchaeia archaeon]
MNTKQGPDFMTSKEVKRFLQMIEKQYGKVPKLFEESAFVRRNERIAIVTRAIEQVIDKKIRINSAGLYIAEVRDDQLRLSIEGSQLIGPHATKNVCEFSREQVKEWLQGKDVPVDDVFSEFVIVKYGSDYLGSGKFKEGLILNFVPKTRRLNDMH